VCSSDLHYRGKLITDIRTNMMGVHNVSNALAALAISRESGLEWDVMKKGIAQFQGVGRRLEKIWEKGSFVVIDDYGHHPTEVRATISALKKIDDRPLYVVFEPHRYSRTQNFWKEFQECFEGADELFLTPIYAASEKPVPGITSENLVADMKAKGKNVTLLSGLEDMKGLLAERKAKDGIFLTLGAGAISKKVREMVKAL
jgi:UDP-N-acetylmuramate--alanine ligase